MYLTAGGKRPALTPAVSSPATLLPLVLLLEPLLQRLGGLEQRAAGPLGLPRPRPPPPCCRRRSTRAGGPCVRPPGTWRGRTGIGGVGRGSSACTTRSRAR